LVIKLRQKHFSVRKILVSPAKSIFTSTWLCQIHSFCRCLCKTKKNPRPRQTKSANALIRGHKLHLHYLYQNSPFPVKERISNSPIIFIGLFRN